LLEPWTIHIGEWGKQFEGLDLEHAFAREPFKVRPRPCSRHTPAPRLAHLPSRRTYH
jgi:hypothetical protein